MIDQDEIAKVRELLKKVPPGPWATCLNAKDIFGIEHADWGCIYANVERMGFTIEACNILRVNCNLLTIEEADAARIEFFQNRKQTNPGLMGAITEYIAAVNPDFVQGLLDEIDQLKKEADWLAESARNECPYESYGWDSFPSERPQWCDWHHDISGGYDCSGGYVECWRRMAEEAIKDQE